MSLPSLVGIVQPLYDLPPLHYVEESAHCYPGQEEGGRGGGCGGRGEGGEGEGEEKEVEEEIEQEE